MHAQMVVVIVPGLPEILEPFLQPNSEPFALALPADKMTEDEQQHFPQYAKYVTAFAFICSRTERFVLDLDSVCCFEIFVTI